MIFAADLHLRSTAPRARTDDFMATQERKLRFILDLARATPPLIVAGDLLDKARSDPWLEQWLITLLREYGVEVICVPGQHDLPEHSLVQYDRSSMAVLEAAGVIRILTKDRASLVWGDGWCAWGCAWGEEPDPAMFAPKYKNILIWHRMVAQAPLWPGHKPDDPTLILRKYLYYQVIVTGDNHQTFTVQPSSALDGKDRWLVNPGSMMRMTAAQIDHKPCVFRAESGVPPDPEIYLWRIDLPIEPGVLDLTQLEQEKARDNRISAFVKRLDSNVELGLDFQSNLKAHMEINPVRDSVKDLIWRWVG